MSQGLWSILEELRSPAYKWVDLTHELTNESPVWPGIPKEAINLGTPCFDWGNGLLECQIQTFTFPGQFGTHIDFPGHFVKGAPVAQAFGADHAIFPLVIIDMTEQVKDNPEYAVTVEDIKAYENKFGPIPEGAFVALRSNWYKKWGSFEALSGVDEAGITHSPGWSLPALQYIYETRNAAGNGHETLDTDASVLAREAGDLACERYVLQQGKIQVELLAHLDEVAECGAILFLGWPRIKMANGLPVRAYAVTPNT